MAGGHSRRVGDGAIARRLVFDSFFDRQFATRWRRSKATILCSRAAEALTGPVIHTAPAGRLGRMLLEVRGVLGSSLNWFGCLWLSQGPAE